MSSSTTDRPDATAGLAVPPDASSSPDRRGVVVAAAAGAGALLAGCASYGGQQAPEPAASSAAGGGASGSASGSASGGGGAPALAALADVPVGGGVILQDAKLVLTQPTAGTVKAFSAVCTHQGCLVTGVANGTIDCACHGSKFKVADGSVAGGPAPAPLPAVAVAVQGDKVVRA